jgi:hypothetical protein
LAGGAAVEVPDGQCVDVPLLAVVARLEGLQAESAISGLHLGLTAGWAERTRVLERVLPSESIQMYSAMTMPRWSSSVYLLT